MLKKVKKQKEEKVEQLDLSLKEPLKNKYHSAKGKVSSKLVPIQYNNLYKHWVTWVGLSVLISNLTLQGIYIYNYAKILPDQIPLFSFYSDLNKRLVGSENIEYYLYFSVLLSILSYLIYLRSFYSNKTVCVITLIISCSSISVLTYNLLKLFSYYV